MCKKLPSDAADFVMEAVPLLTNLLQYHDAKVIHYCRLFSHNMEVNLHFGFDLSNIHYLSFCFIGFRICIYLLDSDC